MAQSNLPTHIYVSPKHPLWRDLEYQITNDFQNVDIALHVPKWISEENKKSIFSKFEKVSNKVTEFSER
jgi:hypothetical protein